MFNWLKLGHQIFIQWFKKQPTPLQIEEAVIQTPPLEKIPTYYLQEPIVIGGYRLCVLEFKEKNVWDTSQGSPVKYVPSIRVLVEYVNESDNILNYTYAHWKLYDKEGYGYTAIPYNSFYEEDAKQKLETGAIGSSKRVKGWVAFHTAGIKPDYVQFRKNYGTDWVIDIKLEPSLTP